LKAKLDIFQTDLSEIFKEKWTK